MEEVIIVGAGPCGLSTAIELQKINIRPLIIEKHSVVHSIYLYPTYMQFFSTAERLEIGDVPFTTPNEKPTRLEALNYYRSVALRHNLRIRTYEAVTGIERTDGGFRVLTEDRFGEKREYGTRFAVISTGYFDHPNMLGIPGEELPKVTHYYREAHPYTGTKVAIIGGNNSAVDAALDLLRVGAEVTVIYRGDAISPKIKPWVRPTFESMINQGRIRMMLRSQVVNIEERSITVNAAGEHIRIDNDFVLALTGFRPDRKLLESAGIRIRGESETPEYNSETMETNVEGLYIAGVIASGSDANEIFIETGRFHGRLIASHIASRLAGGTQKARSGILE